MLQKRTHKTYKSILNFTETLIYRDVITKHFNRLHRENICLYHSGMVKTKHTLSFEVNLFELSTCQDIQTQYSNLQYSNTRFSKYNKTVIMI